MLRLKKEAAAAAEAAAKAAAAAAAAAPAAGGMAVETAAPGGGGAAAAAPAAAGGAGVISLTGGTEGRGGGGGGGGRAKFTAGDLRVQKDIEGLDGGTVGKVDWPDPTKLSQMKLTVKPDSGLWKDATFIFSISVSSSYPHEPPKVTCDTKVYHPNIDLEGHVCLNILRDDWKPIYDLVTVINGIFFLFYEPNPADPLNKEAARLMRDDRPAFERNVRTSLAGGTVDGVSFPRMGR